MRDSRQAELHEQETRGHYIQGKAVAASKETNARNGGKQWRDKGSPAQSLDVRRRMQVTRSMWEAIAEIQVRVERT